MHIIFIYICCCLHIPKLLFSFESLIPGLGRSPGEEKGYPLQDSGPGEFHGLYGPCHSRVGHN